VAVIFILTSYDWKADASHMGALTRLCVLQLLLKEVLEKALVRLLTEASSVRSGRVSPSVFS